MTRATLCLALLLLLTVSLAVTDTPKVTLGSYQGVTAKPVALPQVAPVDTMLPEALAAAPSRDRPVLRAPDYPVAPEARQAAGELGNEVRYAVLRSDWQRVRQQAEALLASYGDVPWLEPWHSSRMAPPQELADAFYASPNGEKVLEDWDTAQKRLSTQQRYDARYISSALLSSLLALEDWAAQEQLLLALGERDGELSPTHLLLLRIAAARLGRPWATRKNLTLDEAEQAIRATWRLTGFHQPENYPESTLRGALAILDHIEQLYGRDIGGRLDLLSRAQTQLRGAIALATSDLAEMEAFTFAMDLDIERTLRNIAVGNLSQANPPHVDYFIPATMMPKYMEARTALVMAGRAAPVLASYSPTSILCRLREREGHLYVPLLVAAGLDTPGPARFVYEPRSTKIIFSKDYVWFGARLGEMTAEFAQTEPGQLTTLSGYDAESIVLPAPVLVEDGDVLIPVELLETLFNKSLTWDESHQAYVYNELPRPQKPVKIITEKSSGMP